MSNKTDKYLKEIDIDSLEVENTPGEDFPDFTEAYFSGGYDLNGDNLSPETLNELTEHQGELLNEIAHEAHLEMS